jgi:hypothetical protein
VKGGHQQYRRLEELVGEAIDAYLAERGGVENDDPLFANAYGRRIDNAYAWRLIRRLAKAPGSSRGTKLGRIRCGTPWQRTRSMRAWLSWMFKTPWAIATPKTTRRYDLARQRRNKRPGRVLAERRRKKLATGVSNNASTPSPAELGDHDGET